MNKKQQKENVVIQNYIRCKKCQTIFKGNPGICSVCGNILTENNYDEVINKTDAANTKRRSDMTQGIQKTLCITAFVVSIVFGLCVCWVPFFGLGFSLVAVTFSIIVSIKTPGSKYRQFAILSLFIGLISVLTAVVITLLAGNDFLDAFFRN